MLSPWNDLKYDYFGFLIEATGIRWIIRWNGNGIRGQIHSKIMYCIDSSILAVYVNNPTNNAGNKSLKKFSCVSHKYTIHFTTTKIQVEENY